jgi:LuxR family transcriptional regulator, maltose regulon positive regulatory protein
VALAAPQLIDRDDLLATLDRAVAARVTVISAPAGSGKTSLLRAWADGPGKLYRLGVMQVRRDQRDAQQFWLALLQAVRQATGTASSAELPAATPDFNAPAMAERVLSELAEHPDRTCIVIDDLHELASSDALSQLAELLADLPAHVHAILATRHDLPLRLHRLRLTGELAEIRAADLRFSLRETRKLLDACGVALPETAAALLHQRAEGWAAGLRLAVISLAGHTDPERFVAEFSGTSRTIAEYLIAEMLERQPEEVRQLLLRTSLLDRVNGELADLLTGRNGSERILLSLEDANAFVVSLDPDRTWFRYHHLFGDLLRLELRRTQPEEVAALNRLAAGWLTQHGQIVDAIRHLQAAADWSDAARLLADHSFSLTLDGQAQTIEVLLASFPPGAAADDPGLALARATANLAQGRIDEAAAHLAVAESCTGTVPPDRRHRLRVATAALKLLLASRRGHLAGVIEQVKFLAVPVTALSEGDIALDYDLRAVALMSLGVAEAWSLGNEDSELHLREGADLAHKIGRPYLEVTCLAELAFASKIESFATARRRCEEAIALADRHGWGAEPIAAPALVTLAGVMTWTGEFDDAERWLQRTELALQTDSGPGIRLLLHLTAGLLDAARGRLNEALAEFTAAGRMQAQLAGPHALASQLASWTVSTQARLGMLAEARASLAALDDERRSSGEIHNARAVICLAEGDPAAALRELRGVLDGSAPVVGYVTGVGAHLLAGVAHREIGSRHAASEAAEHALALAEADRLILPFAITGSQELLEAMPRHETAHASLLNAILDVVHGSSAAGLTSALPAEQLSPSELKVLRYLPTNLSRPEIAAQLSVSVNTVNTHVRSIYAKLGAQSRSSAVQRARDLRLLSASVGR